MPTKDLRKRGRYRRRASTGLRKRPDDTPAHESLPHVQSGAPHANFSGTNHTVQYLLYPATLTSRHGICNAMPHTSRRKPTSSQTKRKVISSDDGWSTVTTASSNRIRAGTPPGHDVVSVRQDPDLTPQILREKINTAVQRWVDTPARAELLKLLGRNAIVDGTDESGIAARLADFQLGDDEGDENTAENPGHTIDNAILLALGSLSSVGAESWRSRFQFAVFLDLVSALKRPSGNVTNKEIKLYIQEPCLTPLDVEVLTQTYGIMILQDPDALERIDERSLLFVTCMEAVAETAYRARVVARGCPLYVTTDMTTVIDRGERLLASASTEEDQASSKQVEEAKDMVKSAKAVRTSHEERAFPGHEEYRALPSALYIKKLPRM